MATKPKAFSWISEVEEDMLKELMNGWQDRSQTMATTVMLYATM